MEAAVGGRECAVGGCGKEPILTVFRTPLLVDVLEGFSGDGLGFG